MTASLIPSDGITLVGAEGGYEEPKRGLSSAILFRLERKLLQDIRGSKDGLRFVAGSAPKLRLGSRTIDLSLSPNAFRTELYAARAESKSSLDFAGLVTHCAEVKAEQKSSQGASGTDEALAALQSSLASYEQEKQSKQTNITNSLLPPPKNRLDAARKNKQDRRSILASSQPGSPSLSGAASPSLGSAPTSAPLGEAAIRMQAIKTPILHLLAMKPTSTESILKKTHVRKEDLENVLYKIGKQIDGKWQLSDRAYRDLDVWNFGYRSEDHRKSAIDNAIKAYDRLRIGRDENIWQMLLPKKDRGKGIVLSRLHLAGGAPNRGLTPQYASSPLLQVDGAGEGKTASAANTPRFGGTTPRPSSSKGDVTKRLLSKDPKKTRAVEEAKEKKRKERKSAASDWESTRPAKRPATKRESTKVKSAEFVHSSDDESGEDGDVKRRITRVDSKTDKESTVGEVIPPTKASPAGSSDSSSDSPIKSNKVNVKPNAKASEATGIAKSNATSAGQAAKAVAAAGKTTPHDTNTLSAPNSQLKSQQRSPQKPVSKRTVPSPLGEARPRVASDVSDRNAVGIQRMHKGAPTPQPLGSTNGIRKRHDTVTSTGSASSASDKRLSDNAVDKAQKPLANGTSTPKAPLTNGVTHRAEQGTKRRSEDIDSRSHDGTSAPKHRKTESTSSQSQTSHSSSTVTGQSIARTSPDVTLDSSSSDNNAASVIDTITYTQGVNLAEKFRDLYYPAYVKMYDEQAAKEAKGEKVSAEERARLWQMHRRLEQTKREIAVASQREHRDE